MDRRALCLVAFILVCACGRNEEPGKAAQAPPAATTFRIGLLGHGMAPSAAEWAAGDFMVAMRDLGYVEGANLTVESRFARGNVDRLPDLATELVRKGVDMIVTFGEPSALAAKRATSAIPILATELTLDPVKSSLVANLARPEGNITGLTTQNEELWQKRMFVFKQIVPKASRIAVFWNPVNPGNTSCVDEIKAAAPALGLQISLQEVRDSDAIERAFVAIAKERPDGLATCWDSVTLAHASAIADFAVKQRLPTLAPIREYVEAGSLMSLGMSLPAHRRRAAHYVDKVLKGTKPSALPVERPLQFDLVINVGTAKALGLVPPSATLVLADDLIR